MARLESYGDDIAVKAMSEVYQTEPQGNKEQPWFSNQVVELEIDGEIWAPEGFLSCMTAIEAQLGRMREAEGENGPRPIDMDVLLWGDAVMDTGFMITPHPRMMERAFVLVPMAEIAPDLVFPDGTNIQDALKAIEYKVEGRKIWQD